MGKKKNHGYVATSHIPHFRTNRYVDPPRRQVEKVIGRDDDGSVNVALDIAHLSAASGNAEYVKPSRSDLLDAAMRSGTMVPDSDGDYVYIKDREGNWSYTRNRLMALEGTVRAAEHLHREEASAISALYSAMSGLVPPGTTPLQTARYILELMKSQGADPENAESNSAKEQARALRKVKELAEELEKLTQEDVAPYMGGGKEGDGSDSPGDQEINIADLADDIKILSIARQFQPLFASVITGSETTKIEDPAGDDIETIDLTDPATQFTRQSWVDQYTAVTDTPYWMYQLENGEIQIDTNVSVVEQKQILYVLLDVSGSMSNADSISIATGVVKMLLDGVVKGESELYIRPFGRDVHAGFDATDPELVTECMRWLRALHYGDGSTRIQLALDHAAKEVMRIEEEEGGIRPQILIVTDGGGNVDPDTPDNLASAGITLNSVMIGGENEELRSATFKTNGVHLSVKSYLLDGRLSYL